jgi:hypothetical protein
LTAHFNSTFDNTFDNALGLIDGLAAVKPSTTLLPNVATNCAVDSAFDSEISEFDGESNIALYASFSARF